MARDDQKPRNFPPQLSIPLQDLSRPPDDGSSDDHESVGGATSFQQSRTRALLGSRRTFSGRIKTHGRYERVLAGTSSDADSSVPHITTPRTAHQPSGYCEDGELSPVNIGEFQAALGGLGVGTPSPQPTASSTPGGNRLNPILEDASAPYASASVLNEGDDYFSPAADDTAPLTDSRYLQPISGSQLPDAPGQRHDRDHKRGFSYSPGMLGDDLSPVDGGLRGSGRRSLNRMSSLSIPSISRSLSTTASPISSAGSMLRKMSQRVVNLSNEPEPVEPSVRRQATIDTPPSFPAMTEYGRDDLPETPAPLEKAPPLTHVGLPRHKWQQQTNPLRGKSLYFFTSDSKLRLWLCELLVHPITEPIILLLIVAQTVILAVEAAGNLPYGGQMQGWARGNPWFDPSMLVLFVIYTLEVVARIIVSGFVKNADEYSTLRPGLTIWQATVEKLRYFFTPERDRMHHHPGIGFADTQVSILRTFKSFHAPAELQGHGRQAQRIRLARRAFLRHSFNRIDFLAVISFWINVILSLTNAKYGRHIYVFQMLSCLRLLRLLSLTSGTSVRICSSVLWHSMLTRYIDYSAKSEKSSSSHG